MSLRHANECCKIRLYVLVVDKYSNKPVSVDIYSEKTKQKSYQRQSQLACYFILELLGHSI
jgi:hypothetical protein